MPQGLTRTVRALRAASLLVWLAALVVLLRALPADRLLASLQGWLADLGPWGPVVLVIVYVAASLLFFPAWIMTVTAGAIYGLALGVVLASISATVTAALALLISRKLLRNRVRKKIAASPKLAAIDEAIGREGWKIVALLRLSPAVPFNLQNYLYGVTAVRFWPCVLVSWLTMLPGTFLYVYLGTLGASAVETRANERASLGEWALRLVGLAATVAVTVYITRLARRAIRERAADAADQVEAAADPSEDQSPRVAPALAWLGAGLLLLGLAIWAYAAREQVRESSDRWLPPARKAARQLSRDPARDPPLSAARTGAELAKYEREANNSLSWED